MGFYEDEKTALKYIRMAEGYDGRELITVLEKHLDDRASVLELGMGPGKDLELLGKRFKVTGSDHSMFFVELYRNEHPSADILWLEASTLKTDRQWDCIYSNKVLHHLDDAQLQRSFARQHDILNSGGLICHAFWEGEDISNDWGLHSQYRTADQLREALDDRWSILHLQPYTEMEQDDSLLLIARKT